MEAIFERLEPAEWLKLNSALQTKKNELRCQLKEKGILKKGGTNKFDNYDYFTEAQYKELFTELLSDNGLELKYEEVDYIPFDGSEKQPNGRIIKLKFYLCDIDTGFYETAISSGEGLDKGDKAGYKAYTGALKYYLANTFLVATGEDAEKESPEGKSSYTKRATPVKEKKVASEKQLEVIKKNFNIESLLEKEGIAKLEDLSMERAHSLIKELFEGGRKDG